MSPLQGKRHAGKRRARLVAGKQAENLARDRGQAQNRRVERTGPRARRKKCAKIPPRVGDPRVAIDLARSTAGTVELVHVAASPSADLLALTVDIGVFEHEIGEGLKAKLAEEARGLRAWFRATAASKRLC